MRMPVGPEPFAESLFRWLPFQKKNPWIKKRVQKVRNPSVQPQRSCVLQPRVAASATLGTRLNANSTPTGLCQIQNASHSTNVDTTPLGLETSAFVVPQGSRGGNPGLEGTTPLGLDLKQKGTGVF